MECLVVCKALGWIRNNRIVYSIQCYFTLALSYYRFKISTEIATNFFLISFVFRNRSIDAEILHVSSKYAVAMESFNSNTAQPAFVKRHEAVLKAARSMEKRSNEKRRIQRDLEPRQQSGVVPLTDYCKYLFPTLISLLRSIY